jgi:RHS repeat-associated protein
LGSVVALTDGDGAVAELYSYKAYGARTIRDPAGEVRRCCNADNTFGFQGHPQDEFTGLVDMRSRWYLPFLGQFTSPDPIGFAGGRNLFAFVGGSPLQYIDPFGLTPVQSNYAQRLALNTWQSQYQASSNQTFGRGASAWDRANGAAGMIVSAGPAAAEKVLGGAGAFVGNIIDQSTLRGAAQDANNQGNGELGAQLLTQADRQSDWAGLQIQGALLAGATIYGGSVVLAGSAGTTAVITIDATGATPVVTTGATGDMPSRLARVISGRVNPSTLARPGAADAFVTPAEEIAGLQTPVEIAKRLTIPTSRSFTIIEFDAPAEGLASPVFRGNPGFVQGGRTAGGAIEFVIPNGPIPAGATLRTVGQ